MYIKYLSPIKFIRKDSNGHQYWLYECKCGKIKEIQKQHVDSNKTKSCGCLRKSGIINVSKTHGLSKHPLYRVYFSIKDRCYNKNCKDYKDYGNRGIKLFDLWKDSFQIFYDWSILNGWQKGLEIERLDNNFGYFPSNCIWTTRKRQNNNTRRNHYLTFDNKTQTIAQWAEEKILKHL